MSEVLGVAIPANSWIVLPAIVVSTVGGAFLANTAILRVVRKLAEKTSTQVDDRIYRLLERYLFPLLTIGGILVLMDSLPLPPPVLQLANRLFVFAALFLLLFLLSKGTLLLIRGLESRYEPIRNIRQPIETGAKMLFVAVGGMILIDNLGISLTPIITTLGVGSLAVAIALQDTLGNLFAGLYVKADRPIKVGHYIRLESGQEGYVDRIGWRSTHIRALQNNLIVVPNSKLAQTIITNFHLPEKRMSLLIPVSVSYDSDPQRVEEILVEEAKNAVGTVDGLLGEPQPFVRFIPGFGDFSLNFTLICQVREFTDQYWVQHELRKRIFKRLGREGMQEAIGPLARCASTISARSLQH